jgi:hypothetical protein
MLVVLVAHAIAASGECTTDASPTIGMGLITKLVQANDLEIDLLFEDHHGLSRTLSP